MNVNWSWSRVDRSQDSWVSRRIRSVAVSRATTVQVALAYFLRPSLRNPTMQSAPCNMYIFASLRCSITVAIRWVVATMLGDKLWWIKDVAPNKINKVREAQVIFLKFTVSLFISTAGTFDICDGAMSSKTKSLNECMHLLNTCTSKARGGLVRCGSAEYACRRKIGGSRGSRQAFVLTWSWSNKARSDYSIETNILTIL